MKKIAILILTTITIIFTATAGLKRVGFSGPQITGVDFTTLQLAHNDAGTLAGDTIQVYPGLSISGFVQTKKLIIIGIGYLTTGTNPNLNLNILTTGNPINIGIITYGTSSSGVSGSEYHGVSLSFSLTGNIGTLINNITVQRCDMTSFSGSVASGTINNLKFRQCLSIGTTSSVTNVTLSNCLMENSFFGASTTFFATNSFSSGSTFYLKNCTGVLPTNQGANPFSFGSFAILVENCIIQRNQISDYANTIFNNCFLTNGTVAPLVPAVTGNNNIFNVNSDLGAMFIGYPTQGTNSNDGRFILKAGSPAIAAGIGGVDCGVFGNTNPYKLSGIPATPAFYKLSAPSTNATANPYQITFSVRSNN